MAREKKARTIGRPPMGRKAMLTPIAVRFPEEMMAEIEAVIEDRIDQPDKGQVIRELVASGLQVLARGRGARK